MKKKNNKTTEKVSQQKEKPVPGSLTPDSKSTGRGELPAKKNPLSRPSTHRDGEDDFSDIVDVVQKRAPDIIVICRNSGMIFANDRFQEILGYTAEEAESLPPLQFVHPDDRLAVHEFCMVVRAGGDVSAGNSLRVLSRKGKEIWLHMKAEAVTWKGESALFAVLRDMTLGQMIEARQSQAQKLEALGTLSAGIAHDFNNMLMSIQGYASLALLERGLTPSLAERIRKIQDIVKSGSALTSQLLGFSGNACYDVVPVDLNEIAGGTSLIMEHVSREITLHKNLRDGIRTIMADRGQIEQVLMNLLVNADQSMPGGGDLYLETANVDVDDDHEHFRSVGLAPGEYVRLTLTDTGVGMDESTMNRIFDPFFSTRNGTEGTGLGLPSTYGIVRAHGGAIDVTSQPGQGTRFDVYFPAGQRLDFNEDGSVKPDENDAHRGTILIVDDEEVVLDVNRELLESLGYRVYEAQSGREALAVYSRSGDTIDLVLLDLVMPGMSGAETYRGLREINPGVKVILLSGYSIEGGAMELLKLGCRAFVQKPFILDNLDQKIQEVLND